MLSVCEPADEDDRGDGRQDTAQEQEPGRDRAGRREALSYLYEQHKGSYVRLIP